MDDKTSLKGTWLGTWLRHMTRFKILRAESISQEWLKLELSNLVHSQIISNLAKSSLKGAWFGSRDPFLHAQLWT